MTLSILWFILVAVLWTVYLILEGFDFGVGMLLPFVAKGDRERTQAVRTIGPHWDGNEVWLLTAGGATFAAFPEWYATMFSGMYLALFLVLTALIVRVMALEWRSKVATEKWRFTWDWAHTISAWLVPLLLGVAFANFVQGMKIEVIDVATGTVVDPTLVDQSLSSATHQLTGGFFSLLTPFTILGGLAVLAVCLAHGAQVLLLAGAFSAEDDGRGPRPRQRDCRSGFYRRDRARRRLADVGPVLLHDECPGVDPARGGRPGDHRLDRPVAGDAAP